MTLAFEAALRQIEEQQQVLRTWLQTGRVSSEFLAAQIAEGLADLALQADVYRFLHDRKTGGENDEDDCLLDALYIYTRRNVAQELGLVLGSDERLPTDPFAIARLLWFSVPHWWQGASGDTSSDLFTPSLPEESVGWSERVAPERICLEPGTFVHREEQCWQSTRFQLFRSTGDAHSPESFLRLVLRQWIEEDGVSIADALDKDRGWQRLLARYEAHDLDDGVQEDVSDEETCLALQRVGLPATPSVQRYLKQALREKHDPGSSASSVLPCRGGMVTTFVLVSGDGKQRRTITAIAPGAWVTSRFYVLAGKCVQAHAAWVRQQPFGDLSLPTLRGRPSDGDDPVNQDIENGLPCDDVVKNALSRLRYTRETQGRALTFGETASETKRIKQRYRDRRKNI